MQEALKVSDLNNYLKSVIDNDFILNNILVKGEISNFKQYSEKNNLPQLFFS